MFPGEMVVGAKKVNVLYEGKYSPECCGDTRAGTAAEGTEKGEGVSIEVCIGYKGDACSETRAMTGQQWRCSGKRSERGHPGE